MLHQEINLYRVAKTPQPAARFLNWQRFIYMQIFCLMILCLCYLYSTWNVSHLAAKKTVLLTQADALQQKFTIAKKAYPALFFSQDVPQSVAALEQELDAQKKMLQTLVMPIPFSQTLIGLSAIVIPDVWLTQIILSRSGNDIILKGKSNNNQILQKYFDNLAREKTFAGYVKNVDDISIPSNGNTNEPLTFQISMKKKTS